MSQFEQIKESLKTCTHAELEELANQIEELQVTRPRSRQEVLLASAKHYVETTRFSREPKIKTLQLDLNSEGVAALLDQYLADHVVETVLDFDCFGIMQCEVALREQEWLLAQKEDREPDYTGLVRKV